MGFSGKLTKRTPATRRVSDTMFGIGTPELIFIFLVGFFIFGPRQLPEIGRQLGEFMAQLRRAADEFKQTWEAEVESERSRLARELSSELQIPAVSIDLTGPVSTPTETEVLPAEGTLARTPSRLSAPVPAAELSETAVVERPELFACPASEPLPTEVSLAALSAPGERPRPVRPPVETVESIGYEG
jgi:Sec-independent protein translocase protein TatA